MREILFRGKRLDNGEWVYGAYQPPVEWGGRKWDVSIASVTEYGWLEDILVIPETVGQFTGLTDKNGMKIFEGDIVRCSTGRICKVTFFISPGVSGFDLVAIGGFDAPPQHNWALFADTEIIGNIHDNPELLEG